MKKGNVQKFTYLVTHSRSQDGSCMIYTDKYTTYDPNITALDILDALNEENDDISVNIALINFWKIS